ncbi:MAG: DNA-directed RNA polymerase subunit omega [Armatimonadetes bacterium]|nr:DNA-directed RNA polymerase subunit omega [Armatimonadota bacterium]
MLPSPDILNSFADGKFVLSNLAAKRANQLREGAIPLVQVESNHPLTIALAEIAAGKIKPIMPEFDATSIEAPEVPTLLDETGDFGVLLPALDETEAALISSDVLVGEEEAEIDAHDDVMSLSDLAGGDDVEDAVEVSGDAESDTLSLSDIAEQESNDEDDNDE